MTTRVIATMLLLTTACLTACSSPRSSNPPRDHASQLRDLAAMMTGSFTSTQQAATDPQNFRDVHLHMTPIWTDREGGPWLYVEQAMSTSLDKPYRQRIYQLRANPDQTCTSAVYKLPGDGTDSVLAFAGAWNNPEMLKGVTPEQLAPLSGCDITLHRLADGSFTGSTIGSSCASNRQGASYTTSEVTITPAMLTSWDRGFNAEGQQVWGATAGGYKFVKQLSR